jgi:putative hydrolase of the HAD superfamily
MLEAVFFDVGNTLLYPHPSVSQVVREVLEEAGHARDLAAIDELMPFVDEYYEDRYRADDTFWTDAEETSDVWVGMYAMLCRRLGIEEAEAEGLARSVYDAFGRAERWRVYDDVAASFDRLAARGIKIGVISNWDRRLRQLLVELGLHERVGAVISSAMVGLHKPDPRIFEFACDRLGVTPQAAAHVGDHYYADVLGARVAGMTPVLIDRRGWATPDGVDVIASLDELDAVLGLE